MYSSGDLRSEIDAKIFSLMQDHQKLSPAWITQSVLNDHPEPCSHFHLCCTRMAIRKEVTQRINKVEGSMPHPQLKLEGFAHLQEYYVIDSADEEDSKEGVPVDLMSDEQLDRKADAYDAMGVACHEHAAEIRRYKELRRAQSQPAA